MDSASSDFFPANHQPGLFRSAAWLNAWHETWGTDPAIQLPDDIAVPPTVTELQQAIVRTRLDKNGLLSINSAFPLGLSTKLTPSIRSEYFFFGAEDEHISQTIALYLDNALRYSWDQLYLTDVLRSSVTYRILLEEAKKRKLDAIHKEAEKTYAVDVRQQFDIYLKGLGKNTRLKLFNRRSNLARLGAIKVENIWPNRTTFFQLLDDFHQVRWGKSCYRGKNRQFINRLLDHLSEQGHEIDFSVLSVAGRPISVVFDIRYQGRQYNLQTGYLQNFNKSISLGTLHFGYQIESAFNNPSIQFYDLMAGKGKHADYKKSLANLADEFVTLLLVRSPALKLAYRLKMLFNTL